MNKERDPFGFEYVPTEEVGITVTVHNSSMFEQVVQNAFNDTLGFEFGSHKSSSVVVPVLGFWFVAIALLTGVPLLCLMDPEMRPPV